MEDKLCVLYLATELWKIDYESVIWRSNCRNLAVELP
jgi:hypothetical protein